MKSRVFLWLLVVAALSGCAANQITGRKQLLIISEEQAIASSATAYTQMMGQLDRKKQIEPIDAARTKKVRDITNRLIAQAIVLRPESRDWKWDVKVIDDPKTVNAFCMAGGKMAMYTGLIEQVKPTDDEIAQVMGHEIGHALAEHTREQMSIALTSQIALSAAAIALGGREGADLGLTGASLAAVYAIQLPNSREAESEADRIGIELAARAGYDPRSAVSLWDKMEKVSGNGPPQFLSTHPSPENRKQALRDLAPKMEPYYVQARARPQSPQTFLK